MKPASILTVIGIGTETVDHSGCFDLGDGGTTVIKVS